MKSEKVELNSITAWFHYSVWWMKLLPIFHGMTLDNHVYFSWNRQKVVNTLSTVRHEMMHVAQYEELGFMGFLTTYIWQWVKHGFSYTKIDLEVEAREASKSTLIPVFHGEK